MAPRARGNPFVRQIGRLANPGQRVSTSRYGLTNLDARFLAEGDKIDKMRKAFAVRAALAKTPGMQNELGGAGGRLRAAGLNRPGIDLRK
jgi:hypothetical protein